MPPVVMMLLAGLFVHAAVKCRSGHIFEGFYWLGAAIFATVFILNMPVQQ
jgi:hypothetical protein